jgi:DNA-directed RNA polymerase
VRESSSGRAAFQGQNLRPVVAYVEDLISQSISEVVSSADQIMNFLKQSAQVVSQAGHDLRWTMRTTGFTVHQFTRKPIRHPVRSRCTGTSDWSGEISLTMLESGPDPDPDQAALSIAPNFVHSLDAAHLVQTILAADVPMGTIHDAVRVRPADAATAHRVLLEELVRLHEVDQLAEFHAQLAEACPEVANDLPDPPAPGDLQIEEVLGATFAFS